jgi:cyclopropane fatty-acyl-phospholipid synthase-like methyltransferase
VSAVWHDLECGGYAADLPLWRALAAEHGDPVLEIGAGTGRVAIDLARHGHRVTALDNDALLLAELSRRADGLDVPTAIADARTFELEQRFAVCLVPMQTIQLLGGQQGRRSFLERARRHLHRGGVLAAALASRLEAYELEDEGPRLLPDMCERDGVVYASHPTAIRAAGDGFVLERRRETVAPDGQRTVEANVIKLDRVLPSELELEAAEAGLAPAGRATVPATEDYSGSEVVILRA